MSEGRDVATEGHDELEEAARRRHVGVTLPREVKEQVREAAGVMGWPVGQWVLTAAAEQGHRVRELRPGGRLPRRQRVPDAAFTAFYLTGDERAEIDDQAVVCGLNRSAFVTAVCRLALGAAADEVLAELQG